ncbi:hypothetical protein NDU88_005136 [Pleurodeles waltl]|uniref:Uncharacterized protein n=1 Tax=Pleurodeles waltl TaxID=8319 RepID=A0AAV7LKI9_PLEWA|nr:hypothetical protein NDU88_005136 [Pleurodeles waltl]
MAAEAKVQEVLRLLKEARRMDLVHAEAVSVRQKGRARALGGRDRGKGQGKGVAARSLHGRRETGTRDEPGSLRWQERVRNRPPSARRAPRKGRVVQGGGGETGRVTAVGGPGE